MMELRKANLTNPEAQRFVLYNDGELAFCQDMHDALTLLPIQMEIYAIVLAMEGKGRIEINGKSYEIKKDDLFICPPNNIVENGLMSLDFKGCFIFVSSDYVQRVMPLQGAWEFKRFINLLESSYPKQRAVSYYADCLYITPKYLSSVCKRIGGQRPSDIIDSYVLKDIDYLMKHTTKSVKEIANELEFPNLSFFGKYVKKHLGVSPKACREQIVNGNKQDNVK